MTALKDTTRDLHEAQHALARAEKNTPEYDRLWRLVRALWKEQALLVMGRKQLMRGGK